VTVKADQRSNIWIAPNGETGSAKEITKGVDRLDGMYGLSWMPDGKVVYASIASGNRDLWTIQPDGSNPKQLTVNTHGNIFPSVSPDGRYIVFVSDRAGALNIWRVDVDGSNPKQLTKGTNELFPSCSPDGNWVIHTSLVPDKQTLWKVSIDGGAAVQFSDKYSRMPVISPDGKLIACYYSDEWSNSMKQRIAIIPFDGGEPTKIVDLPPAIDLYSIIRWAPDGRGLTYISTRSGVSNIWSQPLDGSPPKQLTDFKSDRIFDFDWSRDGQHLALARGTTTNDVVIISDFK
jgi:Tol biopolymer transport system component